MTTKKRSVPLVDSGIDWTKPAGEFVPSARIEQQAEEAPPQDGVIRRYVGDTAASVGRGAVQGVRMLADTAGADNAVSAGLRSVEDYIGSLQSASAKADQQEIARILKDAEGKGVLDQVVAGFRAFGVAPLQTMAQAAGTSLPTIGAALIPGVGPAAVAARFAAPLALGAAQGAGGVKASIYDEVKQRALQEGRTEAEAEQLAVRAQEYSGSSGGQIALGAGLGAWAGKSGLEGAAQRLVYGTGGKAAGGMASRVAMGAVAEGIPEALQGGQEKFASNVAQTNAGFPTESMGGVVANATMEGLAGHVMGGAMGIPNPGPTPVVDPGAAIRATKQPEGGPMTRAANSVIEAQAKAASAGLPPLEFTATDVPKAGKPLALAGEPDTTALDFEADPRFAGAMPFDNGKAPEQPVFATKQLADIHIGEQGAMGTLEPVEAGGGQWTVKQTDQAANTLARANIERWTAKAVPMPEEKARSLAKDADTLMNKRMTPIPMPDGSGWTVVPTQWVSAPILVDYMEQASAAEASAQQAAERAKAAGEEPVNRAPRTKPADPVAIDLEGPATVGRFIADLEATNTPAARAYVQDYRAGRISDAEVMARASGELVKGNSPEPTPDQRIAAAASQAAPEASDGLILNPQGKPFTHKRAAESAQRKAQGGEVLQVAGGWAVRQDAGSAMVALPDETQEPTNAQAARVPPAAAPTAEQEGADSAGAGAAEAAATGAEGLPGGTAAAVEADGLKPAGKKPPFVSKEEGEHLFGTAEKRKKALERIAKGSAYFGAADKARDFIRISGVNDTHEVVEAKPGRHEVRAKGGQQQAAPETAIDRRKRLKAELAAPATTPGPSATPKQTFAEQAQEALDSVPGYKGKNTDGETVYEDRRGVRSILRDGVRITESVSMRPTRGGVKLAVEHKGEFLTAEEAKAAQDARQAPAPARPGRRRRRPAAGGGHRPDWRADRAG